MSFRGFRYAGELYNKYVVENDLDLNRRKLITMVCKKLTKKKSLSQIADELEEDIKENLQKKLKNIQKATRHLKK